MNMNKRNVAANKNSKSRLTKLGAVIGAIKVVNPRMRKILNMFVPTIVPILKSASPL